MTALVTDRLVRTAADVVAAAPSGAAGESFAALPSSADLAALAAHTAQVAAPQALAAAAALRNRATEAEAALRELVETLGALQASHASDEAERLRLVAVAGDRERDCARLVACVVQLQAALAAVAADGAAAR